MTTIYLREGCRIDSQLPPVADGDLTVRIARSHAYRHGCDVYLDDAGSLSVVTPDGKLRPGWPRGLDWIVFGEARGTTREILFGSPTPTFRTEHTTRDGRRAYNLTPRDSPLVILAGPDEATDDVVRRVARNLDSLPPNWRWVSPEEWQSLTSTVTVRYHQPERRGTNLLTETEMAISEAGHTIDEIVFIGSLDSGHSCTWDEFCQLADVEYDSGFGAQEVARDLVIVFGDGSKMWREEYDGSEGWGFDPPREIPTERKPIERLIVAPRQVGWETLASIHEAIGKSSAV